MLDREDMRGVAYTGTCGASHTYTLRKLPWTNHACKLDGPWWIVIRIPIRQEKEEYRR